MPPEAFTWVDKPLLAAMAKPTEAEEYQWLRAQGIQLLISLTEYPPRRDFVNDAGLLLLHVPIQDMHPPSQRQLEVCMSSIQKALNQNMAVGIHCGAGLGRTGTVLACYFVTQGMSAKNAIARVRRLRPGSVETDEQIEAVEEFARQWKGGNSTDSEAAEEKEP
ncbi:MAG: dual specificity protein phosphatase 23 [Gemmataceae bacterium]